MEIEIGTGWHPRLSIRVEVTWKYDGDDKGMPDKETSTMMEEVQDALQKEFKKDPVAVLTGVFTGDNQRDWIFYTLSTHIFGRKLNEVLAPFPLLPLTIYTENDPSWEELMDYSTSNLPPHFLKLRFNHP